jgi:tetratricopeptide (TPR) repeat protein
MILLTGRRATALLAGVALATAVPVLAAQDHQHGGTPPEKLGRVEFATSCKPEAQQRFGRAVALLHSFWFAEADRAFDSIAVADPKCAMAYWGKAMVQLGNPFTPVSKEAAQRGLAAAEKAAALNPSTPRERDYVEAVRMLYRDHEKLDQRTRSLAYEEAMQRIYERYPNDPEAAIFYARAVIPNAPPADKTFARQKRAGAILEPLFQQRPDHPGLAHYIIHAYDAPALAKMAVHAAEQYNQIAPSVPHAQHMPSHIFTRLGMWDASIKANLTSAAAAKAYEEAQQLKTVSFDRAHAWDYLAYAYLQQGQDTKAQQVLQDVQRYTAAPSIAADFAYAAIPARYALERGRWRDAAGLTVRPTPSFRAGEAITHFARGIGAARSNDIAAARKEVEALRAVQEDLEGKKDSYWAQIVEAQRLAVSAWIAQAGGNTAEALRLAEQAAEIEQTAEKHPVTPGPILPARELQGDLLLKLNRPDEALKAYAATLTREPNRARAVFGAARAAELSGDRVAARTHYQHYMKLMAGADGDREEIKTARAFLARR